MRALAIPFALLMGLGVVLSVLYTENTATANASTDTLDTTQ